MESCLLYHFPDSEWGMHFKVFISYLCFSYCGLPIYIFNPFFSIKNQLLRPILNVFYVIKQL